MKVLDEGDMFICCPEKWLASFYRAVYDHLLVLLFQRNSDVHCLFLLKLVNKLLDFADNYVCASNTETLRFLLTSDAFVLLETISYKFSSIFIHLVWLTWFLAA